MRKKAFTIIEFMLATTILAVMLISIAALTIRIIEIYKKGLAMRAVNSDGRDIVSDLSRVIASSPVTNKVMALALSLILLLKNHGLIIITS